VLITIYRFRGSGIIHRNPGIFTILSWVLIAITGICGIAIFYCGITGIFCILTGWDHSLDNALVGMLLLAGAAICGWGNRLR
jgi:hypothetical protein